MTYGLFNELLNEFLNIFFDLGWLGFIPFSIFGVIFCEIAFKLSGDESIFKNVLLDIKKPKDIFGSIFVFFLYGFFGGWVSVAVLGFAAIALDLVLG